MKAEKNAEKNEVGSADVSPSRALDKQLRVQQAIHCKNKGRTGLFEANDEAKKS
jgi:hypothetical protein